MREHSVEIYFFLIIFAAVSALSFFMLLPFLGTLAIAAVFATLFYPLFLRLKRLLALPDSATAGLVLVIVVLLVLLPLGVLGYLVFLEARDVLSVLELNGVGGSHVKGLLAQAEFYIEQYVPDFNFNIREYAGEVVGTLSASLGSIFARAAEALLAVFLGLIAFFYFLKDGKRLSQSVITYSPLRDDHDEEILGRLTVTVNSVVKGTLLVALIQGVIAGVGLALFGVPNPVLLGMLAGIAALVPAVGTAVVVAPAVLYLFFFGSPSMALGLLVWGVFAVGLIDNLIGPHLMGRGTHIHPLFVLLSVLGGLALFGPMGFLLGPIALSLLTVLFEIYGLLIAHRKA
jgi:predicted PurR-regulated permease PerM